jgi:hypothetical protein
MSASDLGTVQMLAAIAVKAKAFVDANPGVAPELEAAVGKFTAWMDDTRDGGAAITYLEAIPAGPDELDPGYVVVHNHVRPRRRLGTMGFRAWTQQPTGRVEICGCKWAPELGVHYRVADRPGVGGSR